MNKKVAHARGVGTDVFYIGFHINFKIINLFIGDPAMLHLLIQQKRFFVEQINELSVEMLKDICKECSVSTNQRSAVSFKAWILF